MSKIDRNDHFISVRLNDYLIYNYDYLTPEIKITFCLLFPPLFI